MLLLEFGTCSDSVQILVHLQQDLEIADLESVTIGGSGTNCKYQILETVC